ncbi:MAG TPA: hypothetical protein VLL04_04600, partial [Rhizomicrobium sp.]|nr:hypothetical protein [Rhizomicrobium sp.]
GDKADAAGVMLVDGVIKTLFWRQTHLNPNHAFRRTSPASDKRPKETLISQNYPACEHATSCGATCLVCVNLMSVPHSENDSQKLGSD